MTYSEDGGGVADLRLYKADEAAKITGLNKHWLTLNARRGRIPHRRPSPRIIRFAKEDLEKIKEMAARGVDTDTMRSA